MSKKSNRNHARKGAAATTAKRAGAPAQKGTRQREHQFEETTIAGQDHLTTLVVPDGAAAGTVLYSQLVGPQALTGTRLGTMSGLYERYRYLEAACRYSSAVPTTIGGQIAFYFDTDPTDLPLADSGEAVIRKVFAHRDAKKVNLWQDTTTHLPHRADRSQMFFTSNTGNAKLNHQARLNVVLVSPPISQDGPLPAGTTIGTLSLLWRCKWDTPQIQSSGLSLPDGGGPPVTPDYVVSQENKLLRLAAGYTTYLLDPPDGTAFAGISILSEEWFSAADPEDLEAAEITPIVLQVLDQDNVVLAEWSWQNNGPDGVGYYGASGVNIQGSLPFDGNHGPTMRGPGEVWLPVEVMDLPQYKFVKSGGDSDNRLYVDVTFQFSYIVDSRTT